MKSKRSVRFQKMTSAGILVSTLCLGLLALGQTRDTVSATGPPVYELSWYSMDGGGVMSSNSLDGRYELSGTIGQPDAGGNMAGVVEPGWELTGGFWFALAPGDCNADSGVNLFDYVAFEECLVGPGASPLGPDCVCFDLDGNGTVDLIDFGVLQSGFND